MEGSVLAYVLDLATGLLRPHFTVKDHVGRIKSIHATPEGRLVTAGEDELLKTYNFRTKKALSTIVGVTGTPVKVLSAGRFLVSGHETGQVFVVGKKDGHVFHYLRAFKTGLKNMALHPSGKLLLCLSRTNRFSMWDLMSCSMVFHKKIRANISGLDFYSDEDLLFHTDTRLYLYSMAVGQFVAEVSVEEEDTKLTDVKVLRRETGTWVVFGCENGCVYFLNQRNFKEGVEGVSWVKFRAYDKRVKRVGVVGNFLVTVSTEGDITVWDVAEVLDNQSVTDKVTIDSYLSLLDYKIQSRPILLEVVAASQLPTAPANEEEGEASEEVDIEPKAKKQPPVVSKKVPAAPTISKLKVKGGKVQEESRKKKIHKKE
jgi:WD40 repeat protein